ncbi:PIN domain-containing protein [Amycolatopsis pithecellobii]|uniref:Ribonuclease VapC n=1 Tax=Amycolatopsis pithecellobii TaxID=664692 RepID=A0A6N7YPN5_9PSEU|nr:PIN domain-containing protein [Amycolatopsis pithecellobii]MTD53962.1 PIN domain-containing protein [Amycolatopsis pithecellobii]
MTKRIVFDTSAIIDPQGVDLGVLAGATPVVTAVTIAELAFGLDTRDPVERLRRTERLDDLLARTEVLPFDTAAAKLYGALAALLRQAGRDPRPRRMDLQIAATAAVHSLPVVTRNSKDFAGLERAVEVIAV